MGDTKISGYDEIFTLGDTDLVVIGQADVANKKITGANLKTSMPLPKNYISGGVLSLDADALHDVNVTSCVARDSTNSEDITLSSEITKQIDVGWSVGDDAGGMDTGAVGNDLLYAVWLIKRSDTGVEDVLFSLSFTAPTMPTDYDYKRLLGWVLTDSSANIRSFRTRGSGRTVEYWFTARQQIATGLGQTSLTAQDVSSIFPTGGMTVLSIGYGAIGASFLYYGLGYDSTNVMVKASVDSSLTAVGQHNAIGNHSTPQILPPNGNNVFYLVSGSSLTLYGLNCIIER